MDPFRSYIGKHVQWRGADYAIERYEVHERALRFVAVSSRDGAQVFLSVREMLDSVVERDTAAERSTR